MSHRILVMLGMVAALALVGCSQGQSAPASGQATTGSTPSTTASSAPTVGAAPDKVVFLTDFSAFGYTSPFFAGVAEGFFAKQNIELKIELGKGSADTVGKVGAGAAQFGLADTLTGIVAINNGAPITYVASHWQRYVGGLCTLPNRPSINSFADVEGKKIGASAGDAYMVLLPELMRQAGADPKGYEHVAMDPSATTAALLAGQVDAVSAGAVTKATRDQALAKQGEGPLQCFIFADHGVDLLGHGIIVNSDLLAKNADLVQRFVTAYATSVAWSLANVDAAVGHYMAANPTADTKASKGDFENSIAYLHDPRVSEGYFYFSSASEASTLAVAKAAYQVDISADRVFTNQFVDALPAALRQAKLP